MLFEAVKTITKVVMEKNDLLVTTYRTPKFVFKKNVIFALQ